MADKVGDGVDGKPSGERKDKKSAGRKVKLTKDLQKKITDLISAGNYLSTACALAGVGESTVYEWIQRGNGEHKNRAANQVFAEFAEAIDRAAAEAEAKAVLVIRKAQIGGDIKREKSITTERIRINAKTGEEEITSRRTIEEVEKTLPDWKAAAWFLERRNPKDWGRKQEISGPGGGAIPVTVIEVNAAGTVER